MDRQRGRVGISVGVGEFEVVGRSPASSAVPTSARRCGLPANGVIIARTLEEGCWHLERAPT